ncbi:DUF3306 domain-containing protein [Aurantimonas coralicida]|uniref:DUF3306 domain-containing protein n=1 Tax=Aurantimonas coralicida TaxID=182270 RepID=UPI001D193EB4|nr:DUF3306 domain-containing protein [Aurantimonas coralicida]MCC4297390.1 DUF3306 domain-containing protein [Aurantimonas coralicida]MDE0923684.1 DUF3306 domain-containing protein [Aurantimonas coralicida]
MADETGDDGGFLSRWSRRKREVEAAEAAEAAEAQTPDVVDPEAVAREAEELEQNRLAAEAVDIDSMKAGDDFGLFMKRGVPELLRRKALRKLWRSNPVFANLDGLNDYDEDFRNPAHNRYTSLWQLGRGFLSTEEQSTQQATGRLSRPEPETDSEAAEDQGEAVADSAADAPEDAAVAEDLAAAPPTDVAEAEPQAAGGDERLITEETGVPIAAVPEPEPVERIESPAQPQPPARRVSIRQRLQG